jgi:hypothetical protein
MEELFPMIPAILHSPGKEEILPLTIRYYGESEGSWNLLMMMRNV